MSHRTPQLVPDAAAPMPSDVYEEFLGGEASVPTHDYGPPIVSRFPDPARRQLEVRDLERRFRDRLLPKLPGSRRGLPARALLRAYQALAMRNRSTVVDEFGRDPARASQASRLFEPLYRHYFRVQVSGANNLPAAGPAILVCNRGGVIPLDVVMLMEAVRLEAGRTLRPLVEDTVHHVPMLGVALARLGAARACRENAERLLERGELIAVFPEGAKGAGKHFAERYQLKRFGRGGFVKIAIAAGVPIIPTAIVGVEDALPAVGNLDALGRLLGLPTLPALGIVPLPSRCRIHVGAPIEVAAGAGISEMTQVVRGRVRDLLAEGLSARGRAFSL